MVVTESTEYNVLLGNTWLQLVKTIINYETNQCTIKADNIIQRFPIICTQKVNPNHLINIDISEELELEESDEEEDVPIKFQIAQTENQQIHIENREYSEGYMENYNLNFAKRN